MVEQRLVEFAQELRREGVVAGTGGVEDFCRATALVGVADLYWAGRATLVSRRDAIPVYDRVFARFFGAAAPEPRVRPKPRLRLVTAGLGDDDREGETGDASPPAVARASRIEILRHKRFADCTDEELTELAAHAEAFARALPRRRSRRRRAAGAGAIDLPATLRRALRTGGEPFDRRYRSRREADRRVIVLLDVSGSMANVSRALLILAHALLRARPGTQVYCFGTRLTAVTRALRTRAAAEALNRVAAEVADWEGGTRIGESVKGFLDAGGHRGSARGAVVVVCSDGLDVGDPELLRAQMARLARLAHRVVWLNPLAEDEAYEPLARGMHAALPYVDAFASGHNLASLEAAAIALR